jgi:hypothetical protein
MDCHPEPCPELVSWVVSGSESNDPMVSSYRF